MVMRGDDAIGHGMDAAFTLALAAYNAGAKFYTVYSGDTAVDHDTRISHIGYDRKHTTAKDSNTWFPLPLMREFAAQGRFKLAKRFHGAPTNRSHRATIETDAPELLRRCREDGAQAAIDAALPLPRERATPKRRGWTTRRG